MKSNSNQYSLLMKSTIVAFALSTAAFSPSASAVSAESCDKINDLANAWNEVSNKLKEEEVGGISAEEAQELGEKTKALSTVTLTVVSILEAGNTREKSSGKVIADQFKALANAKPGEVATKIDNLVHSVDNLTDFCAEEAE